MPICVHLTTENSVRQIQRSGIKANPWRGTKGVFCMPVMPDYYASHQWLRELKRGAGRGRMTMVAINFKLPANELVLVGHYSHPHAEMTVSQAASVIMNADDPLGYEIFLPRAVNRSEIHKVKTVSQVTGWRYFPKAKGRPPCDCCICKGEYKGRKLLNRLREPYDIQPWSKERMMNALREEQDTEELSRVLFYKISEKIRRNPEELEFLLNHDSLLVSWSLAYALRFYRGKVAIAMLESLVTHNNSEVSSMAAESIDQIKQHLPFKRITRRERFSIKFE